VTGRKFKVAAIQMVSTPVVAENLLAAAELIARAAGEGAQLVALPEYFCILGRRETDKVDARERFSQDGDGGPIQAWLAGAAARHGIWLVGGTLPIDCGSATRILNTCLVYDRQGALAARYDKIHLFGFKRVQNGEVVEQFDELYRALGHCDLILVPSAFTATTGRAHWETLLRARAIENLAYVLAPAQGGLHPNGRRTHGHSMLIDPWGEIKAELDEGAGVVMGEIDLDHVAACRDSLPALAHRTL